MENETHDYRAVVAPEYTRDQFIRKVWITFAAEDAPLAMFDRDLGEVEVIEHQVVLESVAADVSYQASVGYDREEPYIDYETYYEDEPYIAYEKQYNQVTKEYEERQVTKYKSVKKQRQVTRYKNVTDWSALSGTHQAQSTVLEENRDDVVLDESLYLRNVQLIKPESIRLLAGEEAEQYPVTKSARKRLNEEHVHNIKASVRASIPGDRCRDLDVKIDHLDVDHLSVQICPEYKVSVSLNGKTYTKNAFAFGSLEVSGDKAANTESLEEVTERLKGDFNDRQARMQSELQENNEARKKEADQTVARKTNTLSLATIALLGASILVSCFIRSTVLVVLMFIAAVAAFVYNTITVNKESAAEKEHAEADIVAETERVGAEISRERTRMQNEIDNYAQNHAKKLRETLNAKLVSLGYKPASADEL